MTNFAVAAIVKIILVALAMVIALSLINYFNIDKLNFILGLILADAIQVTPKD